MNYRTFCRSVPWFCVSKGTALNETCFTDMYHSSEGGEETPPIKHYRRLKRDKYICRCLKLPKEENNIRLYFTDRKRTLPSERNGSCIVAAGGLRALKQFFQHALADAMGFNMGVSSVKVQMRDGMRGGREGGGT